MVHRISIDSYQLSGVHQNIFLHFARLLLLPRPYQLCNKKEICQRISMITSDFSVEALL